jgi:hypothetical protein
MAGISNGVPVVSNLGTGSEPLWAALGWPSLAPAPAPDGLIAKTELVLGLPSAGRTALGRAAAELYRERFSLAHTVRVLRSPAPVTR